MDGQSVSALEYHERTKHTPTSVRSGGHRLDFDNKPRPDKTYVDRPKRAIEEDVRAPTLPALAAVRNGALAESSESTTIETVASLCYYAAGITKEIEFPDRTARFRAAACTGALYHIDLYVVCGDLPGLGAGVYHFHPPTDSLDVLRRGDFRGVLAAASADDRVAEAPVTIVTTSTWWRNAWKYRERTFRHAFWDSGTVAANLLAVAHALGHPAAVVLGFVDDAVAELIGVDPDDEAPLELVPIGTDAPTPAPPDVESIEYETEPLSPSPESFQAIPGAWRAGTLSSRDEVVEWRRSAGPIGGRSDEGDRRAPLDPVDDETASSRPLDRTIERRGSCRRYDREPIGHRKLSTVLDRAVRGLPLDVRSRDDPALAYSDAYIIANAVDGLDPGVYRYRPADGELELLRPGAVRSEAGHLALDQRLGADAAANVYFMSDIDAIVDRLGDRGYRVAQFEAAATAGRLYLATYAHRDLGGTGLTFYDDEVTSFLSPWAADRTPMFLYTVGRPARD